MLLILQLIPPICVFLRQFAPQFHYQLLVGPVQVMLFFRGVVGYTTEYNMA